MANVVVTDDAYADLHTTLQSLSRRALPVHVVDSGTLVEGWAAVLAVGSASGGTDPMISPGDTLTFSGSHTVTVTGVSITLRISGATRFNVTTAAVNLSVPGLIWQDSAGPVEVTQLGNSGHDFWIHAQPGAVNGGDILVEAGAGATGIGGDAILRPGNGGTTKGTARLEHWSGNLAVLVEGDAAHTGGQAVHVDGTGLAFFDGTTVTQPAIVGSRGGNAALASLLTALDSMGLITDNTT